ncbi:hypothetical protein [Micromonospora sp. CPCC 205558]|uniref:hypothetical protein n=1 Tax=Micromonospora sp. CPCC 205558 TaxID=3122403 RepID=UPI002FF2D506
MPALELFTNAGPWVLVAVLVAYAAPRLIVALVAMFKVPPDKLPAVLRALADLFRIRS